MIQSKISFYKDFALLLIMMNYNWAHDWSLFDCCYYYWAIDELLTNLHNYDAYLILSDGVRMMMMASLHQYSLLSNDFVPKTKFGLWNFKVSVRHNRHDFNFRMSLKCGQENNLALVLCRLEQDKQFSLWCYLPSIYTQKYRSDSDQKLFLSRTESVSDILLLVEI